MRTPPLAAALIAVTMGAAASAQVDCPKASSLAADFAKLTVNPQSQCTGAKKSFAPLLDCYNALDRKSWEPQVREIYDWMRALDDAKSYSCDVLAHYAKTGLTTLSGRTSVRPLSAAQSQALFRQEQIALAKVKATEQQSALGANAGQAGGESASDRPAPAAKSGSRSDAVTALQKELNLARKGLPPLATDGAVGAQTRAAIEAFQKQNGLPVTGAFDAATQARLRQPKTPAEIAAAAAVTPKRAGLVIRPVPPPPEAGPSASRAPAADARSATASQILIIGDSHTSGTFGTALDANLRGAYPGDRIETYASCGASPSWYSQGHSASACGTWVNRGPADASRKATPTPRMQDLLQSHPKVVIVALGANMANWGFQPGWPRVNSMAEAQSLAQTIHAAHASCIWIGPPAELGKLSREQAGVQMETLDKNLKAAVGSLCDYIDSYRIDDQHTMVYQGADKMKMHYPPGPATEWATRVAAKVRTALDHANHGRP